jgi:hypothetical protein
MGGVDLGYIAREVTLQRGMRKSKRRCKRLRGDALVSGDVWSEVRWKGSGVG